MAGQAVKRTRIGAWGGCDYGAIRAPGRRSAALPEERSRRYEVSLGGGGSSPGWRVPMVNIGSAPQVGHSSSERRASCR